MTETDPEKRLIGYPRVSTYGQTLDTQLEQLRAAGCSSWNIYRDRVRYPNPHLAGEFGLDRRLIARRTVGRCSRRVGRRNSTGANPSAAAPNSWRQR